MVPWIDNAGALLKGVSGRDGTKKSPRLGRGESGMVEEIYLLDTTH